MNRENIELIIASIVEALIGGILISGIIATLFVLCDLLAK